MVTYLRSWIRVLEPGYLILGSRWWALSPESWVSGFVAWALNSASQVLRLKVWQVLLNVTVITKCDKKLLQNMTGIDKNFDNKLFQRVTGITKWDNYYKVRRINFRKTKFLKKSLHGKKYYEIKRKQTFLTPWNSNHRFKKFPNIHQKMILAKYQEQSDCQAKNNKTNLLNSDNLDNIFAHI